MKKGTLHVDRLDPFKIAESIGLECKEYIYTITERLKEDSIDICDVTILACSQEEADKKAHDRLIELIRSPDFGMPRWGVIRSIQRKKD